MIQTPVAEFTVGESYGALPRFRTYPKIFVEGQRGTAKTRSILGYFLALLWEFPGSRLLLCRRFRTDLTKTVLMTLEEEVFPSFGLPVPGGAHRNNRSEYRLPNGSMIWPAGIDDGMGILSMGITFAYVAEVIEMNEGMVTDIAGGMRWLRSPERPLLPEHSQMILDANPGPPAHWVNQRAEQVNNSLRRVATKDDYLRLQRHNYAPAEDPVNRWKRIITRHQDNPGYWDHDAWDFTPLGRNYVTQQLEGLTGTKRDRWLHGLWKGAEGTVYEFDEDQHTITPFAIPPSWPMFTGFDPGFDHPCAWLWFAVGPNQNLYVIDEIVGTGIGLRQLADMVKRRNAANRWVPQRCWGDPQYIYAQRQESEPVAAQMKKMGVALLGWPRTGGTMDAMVQAVRERLQQRTLKVFKTCTKTIEAFQSWQYRRTASGELTATDGDRYEQDHKDAMDVVRGVVATKPKHPTPKLPSTLRMTRPAANSRA